MTEKIIRCKTEGPIAKGQEEALKLWNTRPEVKEP